MIQFGAVSHVCGVFVVESHGLRRFEVWEAYDKLLVFPLVLQRPHDWMALANVEDAARLEEAGDDVGPAPDIRQPVDSTDARICT